MPSLPPEEEQQEAGASSAGGFTEMQSLFTSWVDSAEAAVAARAGGGDAAAGGERARRARATPPPMEAGGHLFPPATTKASPAAEADGDDDADRKRPAVAPEATRSGTATTATAAAASRKRAKADEDVVRSDAAAAAAFLESVVPHMVAPEVAISGTTTATADAAPLTAEAGSRRAEADEGAAIDKSEAEAAAAAASDKSERSNHHKRQRLLLLYHSSKCPHEPPLSSDDPSQEEESSSSCPVTPYCALMKRLWRHLAHCDDDECKFKHCFSSRCVLSHYRRCSDRANCPTCRSLYAKLELEAAHHRLNNGVEAGRPPGFLFFAATTRAPQQQGSPNHHGPFESAPRQAAATAAQRPATTLAHHHFQEEPGGRGGRMQADDVYARGETLRQYHRGWMAHHDQPHMQQQPPVPQHERPEPRPATELAHHHFQEEPGGRGDRMRANDVYARGGTLQQYHREWTAHRDDSFIHGRGIVVAPPEASAAPSPELNDERPRPRAVVIGTRYRVVVPPGVSPGEAFQVSLAGLAPSEGRVVATTVRCPPDARPGDGVMVTMERVVEVSAENAARVHPDDRAHYYHYIGYDGDEYHCDDNDPTD